MQVSRRGPAIRASNMPHFVKWSLPVSGSGRYEGDALDVGTEAALVKAGAELASEF